MNTRELNKLGINSIVSYNKNQLESYIDNLTKKNLAKGDIARSKIKTAEDLVVHQASVKDSFSRAIGGLPKKSDLKVTITNTQVIEGLICESVILETLPGFYAAANVYKPENAEGILPAVLMVCGHFALGRLYEGYQRVQRRISKAGFVVMGLDPIRQGERITYIEENQEDPAVGPSTIS